MSMSRIKGLAAVVAIAVATAMPIGSFANERNNTLVVGTESEPRMLDPAKGISGTEIPYLYMLYDRLVNFDPQTLDLEPGLATEWSWEDDTTLVMKLREGVTFHDGTEFNAEAVKVSMEYMKALNQQKDLSSLTDIEVRGPYEVALTVSDPLPLLPNFLSDRGGMIISPNAIAKYGEADLATHPVGTGKFMFDEWKQGESVRFVKNETYWQEGEPKLDAVEYKIITNPAAIVTALQSGQIDYVQQIDPVNLPVLERNPNLRVEIEPTIRWAMIVMNTKLEPFDDARVRKAFALSIDREALARVGMTDKVPAQPASLPVPPNYWPSTPALENALTYDPEAAKALLAEAGYPDGVEITICANANSGAPTPGQKTVDLMREQAKAAGITLKSEMLATSSACIEQFNVKKTMPSFLVAWSGRPHPYMTYYQLITSEGPYNVAKDSYGRIDELVAKLLTVETREEEEAVYDELNQEFVEQVPTLPLYFTPNVSVYNAKLAGEKPNLMGKPDLSTLYYK